jgi:hypothetical protein
MKKVVLLSLVVVLGFIALGFRFFSSNTFPSKIALPERVETQAQKENRHFPFAAPLPSEVPSQEVLEKQQVASGNSESLSSYERFINLSDKARRGDSKAAVEGFKLANRCELEQEMLTSQKNDTRPEALVDYHENLARVRNKLDQWECQKFSAKLIEDSKDLIEAAVARGDGAAALISLVNIGKRDFDYSTLNEQTRDEPQYAAWFKLRMDMVEPMALRGDVDALRGISHVLGPYLFAHPNVVKEAAYELASYDIEGRVVDRTFVLTRLERMYAQRLNPTQLDAANVLRRQIVANCCQ